jgi:type 1 glutamine amidotransferase
MRRILPVGLFLLVTLLTVTNFADEKDGKQRTIRALLVTSGCCHDYDYQTAQLLDASAGQSVKIDWNIVSDGGKGTKAEIGLYKDKDWAKNYDVVIHNECFAGTDNPEYIKRITEAHKDGVHAVVIHCAMHTYRAAKINDWRELLGVTSRRHEHQSKYPVKVVAKDHPIMEGFPKDYVTPKDELYVIEKLWPNAKVLATSPSEKNGEEHPVMWTNKYGKARVFGTTYGHSNDTFSDPVFLRTVVRGTIWAATGELDSAK